MTDPAQFPHSARYDTSQLHSCGEDVFISANVEIRRPQLVQVGSHVAIDSGFYLTTAAHIGDHVHLAPYLTVIGGPQSCFVAEDFVGVGAGSRFVCGSDNFMGDDGIPGLVPDEYRGSLNLTTIRCCRFVVLGTNTVVMPGVTLGEGSITGACSLVTKDTEPWTVNIGVPARPVKVRPRDIILEYAKRMGY